MYIFRFVLLSVFLSGCVSSILDSEYIIIDSSYSPAPSKSVKLILQTPGKAYQIIGQIVVRAGTLQKGTNEVRRLAQEVGADAVINIKHQRRFSMDYLNDLYFITADAVIWLEKK